MRYEVQEVYVAWRNDALGIQIFESRGDALRSVNGDRARVTTKRVVAPSGRGPYRKPYVSPKKRGNLKNAR